MTTFEPVKEMVSQLGTCPTDDLIVDRFFEFEDVYKANIVCQECISYEKCPFNVRGIKPIIYLYGSEIKTAVMECDKKLQYERQKKTEKLFESARIPELLKEKTFDNFDVSVGTKEAFTAAREYCQNGGKGIVFAGSCGIGKSHLAGAVMGEELKKFREVVFCTVPELMDDIKRAIRNQEESSDLMELVKNTDLLILDDLGAEKSTEFVAERLFVIVNARLMRKKDTFITTNYQKPSDLIEKMGGGIVGQRIVSRIRELCRWIDMSGKDYRLR
jgi:DNA replication protein DnaC